MAIRISERELILPALFLIDVRKTITTSDLIKELTALLQPAGTDAEILDGRQDTKFSQKVRNLVSHRTLEGLGYANYRRIPNNGLHSITDVGRQYLINNMDIIEYLLSNNFQYNDIKISFNKVTAEKEKNKKILPYDENLMITEGIRKNKNLVLYKRSQKLRDIAIKHYTAHGKISCTACSFDFYVFYGAIGRGYIEIHHIKPVFQYEDERKSVFITRALKNVIPVCSNCHRMIHRRRQNPIAIECLQGYIRKAK